MVVVVGCLEVDGCLEAAVDVCLVAAAEGRLVDVWESGFAETLDQLPFPPCGLAL